jgi:asparagine synthase (glutamine-hydrolysing)
VCGLAGTYARPGHLAEADFLLSMAGELRHRGPDGTGLYLDGRFGMSSTRLAIVDLDGGDQPLSNEDGRYWVMQNGEIYNYVELQAELRELGHRFRTSCDTEVIVHAYEQWGTGCLERFNGDFAIALWDRERREIFLARDRFGVRPLFVGEFGGDFTFASEAKALLRHPAAKRALDPLALVETFTIWSVLPDRSAFVGVRELPPAHSMLVGPDGIIEERRWWDLPFPPAGEARAARGDEHEELLELLRDATRLRLRADVPVAAYISGGLDSSATAALACDLAPQGLSSFGIGFRDPRFDESVYQDRVAEELGTSLTRVTVGAADIAELLPRAIELSEKPTLRTAPTPLLRLSAAVNESSLKVVLTGEGADELFAGYDVFREAKIRRFWAREPDSQLRPLLFARLNEYLGKDLRRSGPFLARFYGRGLTDTDDPLYSHALRFANTARCIRLLSPEVVARAATEGDPRERLRARLPRSFSQLTPLAQAQYLEITSFLMTYLLHSQADRMLMGFSIEGRFPFLDYRVAEFAARTPDDLKLHGLEEKYVLRQAVAPLLPPEIVQRRKVPYRAPVAAALTGPSAPEYVRDLLDPAALADAGVLDPQAVAKVVRKCATAGGTAGETEEMALVGSLSIMLLHEQFVARPRTAAALEPTKVVVGDVVRASPPLSGESRRLEAV